MPKCHFVIPAGGVGLRFGGPLPKQFVEVEGLPILMHTLGAIAPYAESITLALSQDYQEYWHQLCREKSFDLKHKIVEGGATRFLSVRNAIESLAVDPDALIGVHDAVRPLVSGETIEALLVAAETSGAAIPYLPLTDSIRHLRYSILSAFVQPIDKRMVVRILQTMPLCMRLCMILLLSLLSLILRIKKSPIPTIFFFSVKYLILQRIAKKPFLLPRSKPFLP